MANSKDRSWCERLFGKKPGDQPKLNDADTGKDVQRMILAHLRGDRKWYAVRSERNNWFWTRLTFLAILFASLASILAAVSEGAAPAQWVRITLIVLPALSALCGTLLVQMRFQEVCRIRDQGRISIEKLICRAYLIPTEDRASALEEAISIRLAAHELEEDQLAQITGSDRSHPRSEGSGGRLEGVS